MIDTDKIEQEAKWFMGDKDNQQHLAKYVPSLLAEIKRLREEVAHWKKTTNMLVQAHQSVYGSDD